MEKYGGAREATDDSTIRRMCLACWITKATDTLTVRNTYRSFVPRIVTRTHFDITFYVRFMSLTLGYRTNISFLSSDGSVLAWMTAANFALY